MMKQHSISISTRGRGTYNITNDINKLVGNVDIGICHLFVQHTSASLVISENADPSVRRDLEKFISQLAPDSTELYEHSDEGPDDMPAHIRTMMTETSLTLPISNGRCNLGTWQGIYLWEHRTHPHTRQVVVTIQE